jgi:uncharacterized protein YceK
MRTLLLALIVASVGACASVRTLRDHQPGDPLFLSGARLDLAAIRNDTVELKRFRSAPPAWPWLDLPFSFAADLWFWMLPRTPAPANPDGS